MGLGKSDEQGKFLLVDAQLEASSPANDLQVRKNHLLRVDVRDEDVTGDLADVLEKAEIDVFILDPSQFQVPVDVAAIGVPLSEIPVMVLPV